MKKEQVKQQEYNQRKANELYPATGDVVIHQVGNNDKIQDGMNKNSCGAQDKAVECFGFWFHDLWHSN